MIFNSSERKGAFIILLLIAGIIFIPRQVLPETADFFFITTPVEVVKDSTPPLTIQKQTRPSKISAVQKSSIELNSADSAQLVALRGIGPYYASRIIRYRKRLGGFHSINQLKELNMKYFNIDSNAHLFTINPTFIQKADMDSMSFKAILRHPYLEYEDVQLIFNAKRKYGHISIDVLEKQNILAGYKLKKIKPYFK